MEYVTVYAEHEILMEVDNNSALMAWRSRRDSRPAAQASPNRLLKYYLNYMLIIYIFKLKIILSDGREWRLQVLTWNQSYFAWNYQLCLKNKVSAIDLCRSTDSIDIYGLTIKLLLEIKPYD